ARSDYEYDPPLRDRGLGVHGRLAIPNCPQPSCTVRPQAPGGQQNMVVRKIPRSRPRGAVVLETAIIISLVLTVILGVFTYARLLTDWSLLNNAAREGCRYALVNNTSSTVSSSVQSIVTGYMGGET